MNYKLGDKTFSMSYRELRETHLRFCEASDEVFMSKLPEATHLACIISYLKELPIEATLSDLGIVHQLCHLMTIPLDHLPPGSTLQEIRELFRDSLMLA